VTGVSPTSGPGSGGTSVTITGANFQNVQSVYFGGALAPTPYQTSNSGGSLTVTSPASTLETPGVVDVRVTTYGGTSATTAKDQFDYTTPGPNPMRPQLGAAVEGDNGGIYAAAPQLGSGWHGLGGRTIGAPAVAAQPSGSRTAIPIFVAVGTNHALYVRTLTRSWQQLSPGATYCLDNPAAAVIGNVLYVACEGGNHALYVGSTGAPSGELPVIAHFTNYGGVLGAGPAIAAVGGANGTPFFFATGANGGLYTRTATHGWGRLTLTCTGHPAAGIASASTTTYVACNDAGRLLYLTTTGNGWGPRTSLGGSLVNGPGVAATNEGVFVLVEGHNRNAYLRGLSLGWTDVGGVLSNGAEAAGLT
jgi:hypothetical protein